jgi:hypothetical protein
MKKVLPLLSKKSYAVIIAFLFFSKFFGQNSHPAGIPSIETLCAYDSIIRNERLADNEFQNRLNNVNTVLRNYINAHSGRTVDPIDPNYNHVIPVVVHIIRDPSDPLPIVSYAQVESQINALNRDFSSILGPHSTNTRIQFCLAPNPAGIPWTNAAEPGVIRWDEVKSFCMILQVS